MPRITAEPPKDPQKQKAEAAEQKYVNQSAEPNDKTEDIKKQNLYADQVKKKN